VNRSIVTFLWLEIDKKATIYNKVDIQLEIYIYMYIISNFIKYRDDSPILCSALFFHLYKFLFLVLFNISIYWKKYSNYLNFLNNLKSVLSRYTKLFFKLEQTFFTEKMLRGCQWQSPYTEIWYYLRLRYLNIPNVIFA